MTSRFLDIKMQPVAKARPKLGRHGIYTPSSTIAAEKAIAVQVRNQWRIFGESQPWDCPIELEIEFRLQRPKSCGRRLLPCVRPDLDNYLKLVLDACNTILWVDDALICKIVASKRYSRPTEYCGIRMEIHALASASPPKTKDRRSSQLQKPVVSESDALFAS